MDRAPVAPNKEQLDYSKTNTVELDCVVLRLKRWHGMVYGCQVLAMTRQRRHVNATLDRFWTVILATS